MQRLEVSGAVRPLYGSLSFKGLMQSCTAYFIDTSGSRKWNSLFWANFFAQFLLQDISISFSFRWSNTKWNVLLAESFL